MSWLTSISVFLKIFVCLALQRIIDDCFLVAFVWSSVNIEFCILVCNKRRKNGTRKFCKFSQKIHKKILLYWMDMIECRFNDFDFMLDGLNFFYETATFVNDIEEGL